MLIAAAICPHPPLLIPEATGAPGARDQELDRTLINVEFLESEHTRVLIAHTPDFGGLHVQLDRKSVV